MGFDLVGEEIVLGNFYFVYFWFGGWGFRCYCWWFGGMRGGGVFIFEVEIKE